MIIKVSSVFTLEHEKSIHCYIFQNEQCAAALNFQLEGEKALRHISDSHTPKPFSLSVSEQPRGHSCALAFLRRWFLASATHSSHVESVNNH